jgi:hypothetical protein
MGRPDTFRPQQFSAIVSDFKHPAAEVWQNEAVITLENFRYLRRYALEPAGTFFWRVSNDSFLIFRCRFSDYVVVAQIRRHADRCSSLLAIDACLLTKMDFL